MMSATHVIEQLRQFFQRPLNLLDVVVTVLDLPVGCPRLAIAR